MAESFFVMRATCSFKDNAVCSFGDQRRRDFGSVTSARVSNILRKRCFGLFQLLRNRNFTSCRRNVALPAKHRNLTKICNTRTEENVSRWIWNSAAGPCSLPYGVNRLDISTGVTTKSAWVARKLSRHQPHRESVGHLQKPPSRNGLHRKKVSWFNPLFAYGTRIPKSYRLLKIGWLHARSRSHASEG